MSRLVQGGAAFGGLYQPVADDVVDGALQEAWRSGIRSFDTAPHYGVGLSEERVGRFLAAKPRESFTLSTKVGRLLVDDPAAPDNAARFFGTPRRRRVFDFSAEGIRRSLADSRGRLGLDRVDTAFIHDPQDHLRAAIDEAIPELERLKDAGEIGAIGVGCNFVEVAEEFVRHTRIDCLMMAGRYSLLDRRAERLFGLCADKGVRVLVAGVFNGGLLVGDAGERQYFNYRPASRPIAEAAQRMEELCREAGVSLRAAALQFPLRHSGVDAVVLGAGTASEVQDSVRESSREIPAGLWGALAECVPSEVDLAA